MTHKKFAQAVGIYIDFCRRQRIRSYFRTIDVNIAPSDTDVRCAATDCTQRLFSPLTFGSFDLKEAGIDANRFQHEALPRSLWILKAALNIRTRNPKDLSLRQRPVHIFNVGDHPVAS